MAKVDYNGDGKPDFTINIGQIIAIVSIIVSMAGSYYTLKNKIEVLEARVIEAKELPKPEISRTEYDLKDELIRETIMNTQQKVDENGKKLDKIEERLFNLVEK